MAQRAFSKFSESGQLFRQLSIAPFYAQLRRLRVATTAHAISPAWMQSPYNAERITSLLAGRQAGLRRSCGSKSFPILSTIHHQSPAGGSTRCLRYGCAEERPKGASEYDLSRGKIIDVLRSDYSDFVDRIPSFDIYCDDVVMELGKPFDNWAALRGKDRYMRGLGLLRSALCKTVSNAKIECQVYDGKQYGHDLRVTWNCKGDMDLLGLHRPISLSAVSLYSLAPAWSLSHTMSEPSTSCGTADAPRLAYRVNRHNIEFTEIHPDSLRSWLLGKNPLGEKMQPSFAYEPRVHMAG